MGEYEFLQALAADRARSFFEKDAFPIKDFAKNVGRQLLKTVKDPRNIGGTIGAAATTAAGFAAAKRWKGNPSYMERDSQKKREHYDALMKAHELAGTTPSFGTKMLDVASRSYSSAAKVMAEHPRAASSIFAGTGWSAGRLAGSAAKNIYTRFYPLRST